jgi:hypothetical protein
VVAHLGGGRVPPKSWTCSDRWPSRRRC